jgi:hypothetical protein
MGVFVMKRLILVAAVLVVDADAEIFKIYNNTQDSFSTDKHAADFGIIISNCSSSGDGVFTLPGHTRADYDVRYPEGCPHKREDGSVLSFHNDRGKFEIAFLGRYLTRLRSDDATELHNNKGDSYTHEYIDTEGGQNIGSIINWLIVDRYRVVYCSEKQGRGRSILVIEYSTDDDAWMDKVEDDDWERRVGLKTKLKLPPRPKRHWWSGWCSYCTD